MRTVLALSVCRATAPAGLTLEEELRHRRRPEWFDWGLVITDHVLERMESRSFNEADLRLMLDSVRLLRTDPVGGRWIARTKLDGGPWDVILEPDYGRNVLVVITAYPVDP